jgi:hypothetical protein
MYFSIHRHRGKSLNFNTNFCLLACFIGTYVRKMAEQAVDNTQLHRENIQPTKRHFEWLELSWQRLPPSPPCHICIAIHALCSVLCKMIENILRLCSVVLIIVVVWTWWTLCSACTNMCNQRSKGLILPSD